MHTILDSPGSDHHACDDLLASAESDVWWPQLAMALVLSLALSALLPWATCCPPRGVFLAMADVSLDSSTCLR